MDHDRLVIRPRTSEPEPSAPTPSEEPGRRFLTPGERIGNLVFGAVEAGVAYLTMKGEVDPHATIDFARDLVLSAIVAVSATAGAKDLISAVIGYGKPSVTGVSLKEY